MTLLRDWRRLGAWVLAPMVLATALLAACGGGSSQVSDFVPARLIVFGDESSVITNDVDANGKHDGFKYTLNDRRLPTGVTTGRCQYSPIIAQYVASVYGFVFEECNPSDATVFKALMRAAAGAKAADLGTQRAGVSNLGPTDMVSVMIGTNDLVEIFNDYKIGLRTSDGARAEAGQRGKKAAQEISEILATGARALVMTVPDLGLSPLGKSQSAGDRQLLADMSYQYNGNLRTNILPNDGRNFALVLVDDIVAAMDKQPTSFLATPYSTDVAVCTPATWVPATSCVILSSTDLTQNTVVAGGSVNTHLWATDVLLGPEAHARIGQQAQLRATNNPF